MKNKHIPYVFDSSITYKRFYSVWKKFPIDGIVPEAFIKGKIIWEMIRDKKMVVYISPKEEDIIFSLRLPKNYKVIK